FRRLEPGAAERRTPAARGLAGQSEPQRVGGRPHGKAPLLGRPAVSTGASNLMAKRPGAWGAYMADRVPTGAPQRRALIRRFRHTTEMLSVAVRPLFSVSVTVSVCVPRFRRITPVNVCTPAPAAVKV